MRIKGHKFFISQILVTLDQKFIVSADIKGNILVFKFLKADSGILIENNEELHKWVVNYPELSNYQFIKTKLR
jgi:hypothetical protein